jgi:hypothetical protein
VDNFVGHPLGLGGLEWSGCGLGSRHAGQERTREAGPQCPRPRKPDTDLGRL